MMNVLRNITIACFATIATSTASAQEQPLSEALSRTAMHQWKDSFALGSGSAKWSYDLGVILKGMEGVWRSTGNGDYFRYIQKMMDFYVQSDGSIKGYKKSDFNIDFVNNGKLLLLLYNVTGQEKYRKAAAILRAQLDEHPRTKEGGFWHKKIYTWQMWLDGLYMGQPFYAEYAKIFNQPEAFNDITRQFVLMEQRSRDPKTGLLYHGYDESREQQWANKTTGTSPHFWGRSLGWYGMALVDALDYFPEKHPGKDSLIGILNRLATAVVKYQYPANGLWYQVTDRPDSAGNYPEASASCMLTYMLAKGVRKGYLPAKFKANAQQAYAGIQKQFIRKNEQGLTILGGTVSVAGLGGKPYRDGSYDYYLSEKVIDNDPKGMGAFILCALEMENAAIASKGNNKLVVLDRFFNNEFRKTADGRTEPFHYIWEEQDNGGYSGLQYIIERFGSRTGNLAAKPDKKNLKGASVYIIVDPDTEKETAHPQFITADAQKNIAAWVKKGGTLLLMANDKENAEFTYFNQLAGIFGIKFNEDSHNRVQKNNYVEGTVKIPEGNPVFSPGDFFIKEYASIETSGNAKPLVTHEGRTVMALAVYGKGRVLAIGDPWIYNEYADGRRLPAHFHNFEGAEELVKWLVRYPK